MRILVRTKTRRLDPLKSTPSTTVSRAGNDTRDTATNAALFGGIPRFVYALSPLELIPGPAAPYEEKNKLLPEPPPASEAKSPVTGSIGNVLSPTQFIQINFPRAWFRNMNRIPFRLKCDNNKIKTKKRKRKLSLSFLLLLFGHALKGR